MGEKQRIRLLKSHKILLQIRSEKINEAVAMVQVRNNELQASLNLAIVEVGVPAGELNLWRLSEDGQAIEKIEIPETLKKKDKEKE